MPRAKPNAGSKQKGTLKSSSRGLSTDDSILKKILPSNTPKKKIIKSSYLPEQPDSVVSGSSDDSTFLKNFENEVKRKRPKRLFNRNSTFRPEFPSLLGDNKEANNKLSGSKSKQSDGVSNERSESPPSDDSFLNYVKSKTKPPPRLFRRSSRFQPEIPSLLVDKEPTDAICTSTPFIKRPAQNDEVINLSSIPLPPTRCASKAAPAKELAFSAPRSSPRKSSDSDKGVSTLTSSTNSSNYRVATSTSVNGIEAIIERLKSSHEKNNGSSGSKNVEKPTSSFNTRSRKRSFDENLVEISSDEKNITFRSSNKKPSRAQFQKKSQQEKTKQIDLEIQEKESNLSVSSFILPKQTPKRRKLSERIQQNENDVQEVIEIENDVHVSNISTRLTPKGRKSNVCQKQIEENDAKNVTSKKSAQQVEEIKNVECVRNISTNVTQKERKSGVCQIEENETSLQVINVSKYFTKQNHVEQENDLQVADVSTKLTHRGRKPSEQYSEKTNVLKDLTPKRNCTERREQENDLQVINISNRQERKTNEQRNEKLNVSKNLRRTNTERREQENDLQVTNISTSQERKTSEQQNEKLNVSKILRNTNTERREQENDLQTLHASIELTPKRRTDNINASVEVLEAVGLMENVRSTLANVGSNRDLTPTRGFSCGNCRDDVEVRDADTSTSDLNNSDKGICITRRCVKCCCVQQVVDVCTSTTDLFLGCTDGEEGVGVHASTSTVDFRSVRQMVDGSTSPINFDVFVTDLRAVEQENSIITRRSLRSSTTVHQNVISSISAADLNENPIQNADSSSSVPDGRRKSLRKRSSIRKADSSSGGGNEVSSTEKHRSVSQHVTVETDANNGVSLVEKRRTRSQTIAVVDGASFAADVRKPASHQINIETDPVVCENNDENLVFNDVSPSPAKHIETDAIVCENSVSPSPTKRRSASQHIRVEAAEDNVVSTVEKRRSRSQAEPVVTDGAVGLVEKSSVVKSKAKKTQKKPQIDGTVDENIGVRRSNRTRTQTNRELSIVVSTSTHFVQSLNKYNCLKQNDLNAENFLSLLAPAVRRLEAARKSRRTTKSTRQTVLCASADSLINQTQTKPATKTTITKPRKTQTKPTVSPQSSRLLRSSTINEPHQDLNTATTSKHVSFRNTSVNFVEIQSQDDGNDANVELKTTLQQQVERCANMPKLKKVKGNKDLALGVCLQNREGSGVKSGYLQIKAGGEKVENSSSCEIVYTVHEGVANVCVRNEKFHVKGGGEFAIGKGLAYSISNVSKERILMLHFVKIYR